MVKIKNIEKVAQRLKKNCHERVVLYGDADIDGACSVIILEETLKKIGFKEISVYFPDRVKEGYGLNLKALDYLNSLESFLLIILDSGITSFSEVKEASKRGIETIIIDHHQPLDEMPLASLIINVKQKKDKYPFKNFANAGLVFKLAEEILGRSFPERKNFLELAALATIADMMEQREDNKYLIKKGLESLENTQRIGLKVLKSFFDPNLMIREKAQKMISVLNSADVVDHRIEIYDLLITQDEKKALDISEKLLIKNNERHEKIKEITEQVMNLSHRYQNLVFESSEEWDESFLGSVASRVCSETNKTVFLFKKGKKDSRGAVRASSGVNAVDVMNNYSYLLDKFGGHPPAAGLTLKTNNLKKLEKELVKFFEK